MRPGARLASIAAVATLALAVGPGAAAAKPAKRFQSTVAPNAAIPDAIPGTRSVPLTSTITVPKKFKGRVVGDVNVLGLQTAGSAEGAANHLTFYLISPTGRTLQLVYLVGDQSLGPWAIDDESATSICPLPPTLVCPNPAQTLLPPFAGTSNTLYNWAGNFVANGTLGIFDGVRMNGAWTLLVTDRAPDGTSTLNRWGLKITAAKPVKK